MKLFIASKYIGCDPMYSTKLKLPSSCPPRCSGGSNQPDEPQDDLDNPMMQLLVEVALRELSDNEDGNPESSDDDESVSSEDSYVASGSRSGFVAPPLFRRPSGLTRLARLGRRIMDDRLPAGGNDSDDSSIIDVRAEDSDGSNPNLIPDFTNSFLRRQGCREVFSLDVIGTKVDVLGNGNCGFYSLIKGLILAGNQVLIDLFGYPQDDGVTMYEYVTRDINNVRRAIWNHLSEHIDDYSRHLEVTDAEVSELAWYRCGRGTVMPGLGNAIYQDNRDYSNGTERDSWFDINYHLCLPLLTSSNKPLLPTWILNSTLVYILTDAPTLPITLKLVDPSGFILPKESG